MTELNAHDADDPFGDDAFVAPDSDELVIFKVPETTYTWDVRYFRLRRLEQALARHGFESMSVFVLQVGMAMLAYYADAPDDVNEVLRALAAASPEQYRQFWSNAAEHVSVSGAERGAAREARDIAAHRETLVTMYRDITGADTMSVEAVGILMDFARRYGVESLPRWIRMAFEKISRNPDHDIVRYARGIAKRERDVSDGA